MDKIRYRKTKKIVELALMDYGNELKGEKVLYFRKKKKVHLNPLF